jgi:hypothetical protein
MAGEKLADLDVPAEPPVPRGAVKEAVVPFNRVDGDTLLGPEMQNHQHIQPRRENVGHFKGKIGFAV